MTQVCASGHQHVYRMKGYQVTNNSPHSPSYHRSRESEEDEGSLGIIQHLEPNLETTAQVPALKGSSVECFQRFANTSDLRNIIMLHGMFESVAPRRKANTRRCLRRIFFRVRIGISVWSHLVVLGSEKLFLFLLKTTLPTSFCFCAQTKVPRREVQPSSSPSSLINLL